MTDYKQIVGTGSWYVSQTFNDYREEMDVYGFLKHICDECVERVKSLDLKEGDLLRLSYIGSSKMKRYVGVYDGLGGSYIYIKQKKRTVSFNVCLIDNIEVVRV